MKYLSIRAIKNIRAGLADCPICDLNPPGSCPICEREEPDTADADADVIVDGDPDTVDAMDT